MRPSRDSFPKVLCQPIKAPTRAKIVTRYTSCVQVVRNAGRMAMHVGAGAKE